MSDDDRARLVDDMRLEGQRLARAEDTEVAAALSNGIRVIRRAWLRGFLVGSVLTATVLLIERLLE